MLKILQIGPHGSGYYPSVYVFCQTTGCNGAAINISESHVYCLTSTPGWLEWGPSLCGACHVPVLGQLHRSSSCRVLLHQKETGWLDGWMKGCLGMYVLLDEWFGWVLGWMVETQGSCMQSSTWSKRYNCSQLLAQLLLVNCSKSIFCLCAATCFVRSQKKPDWRSDQISKFYFRRMQTTRRGWTCSFLGPGGSEISWIAYTVVAKYKPRYLAGSIYLRSCQKCG